MTLIPSPHITDAFHSLSDAGWYAAAYMLTAAALQPTWGKVYQMFAVKNVFQLSVGLFSVGSLICGVSPNSKTFIIGRAVAGIGCGGVYSGALAVIAYTISAHRRPAVIGILMGLFMVNLHNHVC